MAEESEKATHGGDVARAVAQTAAMAVFAVLLSVVPRAANAGQARVPPQPAQGDQSGAPAPSTARPGAPPERYTLSPERRAKAIAFSRARYVLYFADVALSILIYLLLWRGKVSLVFRNWARRFSARHFVQCLVFAPVFLVSVSVLRFPLDIYSGFTLERRFDLSPQSLASWMSDWGKSLGLEVALGIFLIWLFTVVVRRSPRRWWFYFWLVTIPVALGLMMAGPVIVDPLFHHFKPLDQTQPALTGRIEQMLHHAGLDIPPSQIFEMDASTKTRAIDAYVTGVGATKRVVVWDTTIQKLDEDETLLVLGHETGHYVLGHVLKEFAWFELAAIGFFFLGFVAANKLIERAGARTGLEGIGDLAALPALLLVGTALAFPASPVICAISRHYEHQADQFGLEVAYGVVPDPNAAEARALETLGEEDLADPDPNPIIKFWLYTHPPLDDRIRFAMTYKPWAAGKPLELLHPRD